MVFDMPQPGPHMVEKLDHPARHKILCMGRRWRKTTLGLIAAIGGHGPNKIHIGALQSGNIWFVDQNHPSSSSVWLALRGMLRPLAKHISESNRRVLLKGGGAVTVKSAASVDSLVGDIRGLDGVVMNEGAKFSPLVWQKAIRPALSDRHGWSIWPSTPEGLNYYHALFEKARAGLDDWAAWQEPSSANPFWKASEIDAARAEGTPDNIIRQEYFAEFIVMGPGRTYHEFERAAHLKDHELNPAMSLDLCVSFGVAPAAWLVVQGDRNRGPERVIEELRPEGGDVSVRAYLDEFRSRYPMHADGNRVRVFGEVGVQGAGHSDFEALRAGLPRARHRVSGKPYDEKDRVNSVNAILRDQYGQVRGYVSPRCERLIRDLEGTRNMDASYRVGHTAGLGFYAAAWGAKLMDEYPVVIETREASENVRRWPESTPEARRCQGILNRAVANGTIIRPKQCEECKRECKPEGAHYDYQVENALRVRWLCKSCHTSWDNKAPKGGVTRLRAV